MNFQHRSFTNSTDTFDERSERKNMCNIAGYVGVRPAAPILIEMIRRQQGFSGGYFTGLATVDTGRIFSAKCRGDLDHLLLHSDAIKFEGTCGIIHSRSKGSGGDLFAHPFLGGKEETPQTAYVANGLRAKQRDDTPTAQALFDEGYRMGQEQGSAGYIKLKNGNAVHISDVMCQLITRHIDKGLPAWEAMKEGFFKMPSENVGLLVERTQSDRIFFARYNFPMFAAFDESGCCLASTPFAFLNEKARIFPIPPMSYGFVTKDSLTVLPMKAPPLTVSECGCTDYQRIASALTEELKKGKATFGRLARTVSANMPQTPSDCPQTPGDCPQTPGDCTQTLRDCPQSLRDCTQTPSICKDAEQLTHILLFDMKEHISQSEIIRPGVAQGLTAPETLFEWKE